MMVCVVEGVYLFYGEFLMDLVDVLVVLCVGEDVVILEEMLMV